MTTEPDPELALASREQPGPPAPSLEGEAMRRRIGARLFGEPAEPLYIGRFRVLRSLGHGGMGVVYAAVDDKLGREVALKVILPDAGDSRVRERERLLAEARALARLAHPNVIGVYEVGEHGDEIFIAMEYVRGCTLLQWLKTPRTQAQLLAQFVAAGRGLAAAHAVGLVHRDFKPGNVLIGEDDRARIVDFGLARGPRAPSLQEQAVSEPDPSSENEAPASVTEPQAGTPGYMSPEQALARGCDARSDQFSFCVALYEALYGHRPFRGDLVAALVRQDVLRPAACGQRGRVPGWLRRVLARGLAFAPEARFASMDALLAALAPRPGSRWLLVAATGLALAAGVLGPQLRERAGDRCPSAHQALLATWGPERREEVRRAFQATQAPGRAEAAWAELARPIDDYADAWARASRDACEQTQVHAAATERSLYARRLCLEDRREQLAEVIELIARREATLAGGARELIARLPAIAGCEAVDAGVDVQRIDGQRARVRHDLGLADKLRLAGRSEEAQRRLAGLQVAVRGLGDLRLELEVTLLRAVIAGRERRDAATAEQLLHAAAVRLGELGPGAPGPEIWNEYAWVAADLTEDAERARERLEHAQGFVGGRADPLLRAAMLTTASYIERLVYRPAEALRLRQDALALRRDVLPSTHPEVAHARMLVANALADQEKYGPAEEQLRVLLGEQIAALGDAHPSLLNLEKSLGMVQFDREDFAAAGATLTRARTLAAALYGSRSAPVAEIDVSLSRTIVDPEAAILRLRGALAVLTARGRADADARVLALQLLADRLLATREYAMGLEVNRELLALHDRGAQLDIESVLVNIGDYLCLLGRCAEATGVYQRLFDLRERARTPGAEALALQGLGRVHLARGRPYAALPLLERAREILLATPRPTQHLLEQCTRLIGECLGLLGQTRRARVMLAEADRLRAGLGLTAPE